MRRQIWTAEVHAKYSNKKQKSRNNKITGQEKVQEETAKFWEKIFADEGIKTTEEDIKEYLGEKAFQESRRVIEKEQEEMDLEITLDDIEDTVKNLKKVIKHQVLLGLQTISIKNFIKTSISEIKTKES